MPSKYSPRTKRPPSPYSVSQSPRTPQRVWRSLSSTGQANSSNAFAENSKEKWLRSLRQGTDVKRSPIKGNHNVHRDLNLSLSSSSDYLREQLGVPDSARKHRRSNSVDMSYSGTPRTQYRSPEDMYDEIISLKKSLVVQKNEYDVLKAKTRRLEEDNTRKEKYIEKLLDPKSNDESIRRLAEGKSQSGSSITTGLKQRILKLEKQLRDKENELNVVKNDTKTTDITEMKTAMEIYYQEVLRLRDIVSSQEMMSERLNSSLLSERDAVPTKIKALRRNVVQLTAENNRLAEDNQRLKRDLDKAIGEDEDSGDEDDGPIKLNALSRVELVSLIKKSKISHSQKMEEEKTRNAVQVDKLKNIISQLKEEKYELREENKKFKDQNENLENDLDKQTYKVSDLRNEIEIIKEKNESQRSPRERRRSVTREGRRQSVESNRPRKMSRSADKNKAASSIQKQWREHKARKRLEEDGDDVVYLQSALRGHTARKEHMNSGKKSKSTHSLQVYEIEDSSDSESDDDVVYLQSALRGHMERKSNM